MKGIIIKDIISIKKNILLMLLTVLVLIAFVTLVLVGSDTDLKKEITVMIPLLIMLLFSEVNYVNFTLDRKANFEKRERTLPITSSQVVTARYISTMIFLMFSFTIVELAMVYLASISKIEITKGMALVPFGVSAVLLIKSFMQLPFMYKFKNEIMPTIIMIVIISIPCGIFLFINREVMGTPEMVNRIVSFSNNNKNIFKNLLLVSPVIVIVSGVISMYISSKIYERGEV